MRIEVAWSGFGWAMTEDVRADGWWIDARGEVIYRTIGERRRRGEMEWTNGGWKRLTGWAGPGQFPIHPRPVCSCVVWSEEGKRFARDGIASRLGGDRFWQVTQASWSGP